MRKQKHLSHLEWVQLACADDDMRLLLTGVHVTEERIAATNGHILFLAPNEGLNPGVVFDPKTGSPIEGHYPNYQSSVLDAQPKERTFHFYPHDEIFAICAALSAGQRMIGNGDDFSVTWPTANGRSHFNPDYLTRVLKGTVRPDGTRDEVDVYQAGSSFPAFLRFGGRLAVLMTLRAHVDYSYSATVQGLRQPLDTCPAGSFGHLGLDQFLEQLLVEREAATA